MTDEQRDRPSLSPQERRFVNRLNAAYRPLPMTARRRAALDARVRRKLDKPRWHGPLVLGFTVASIVTAFLWVGLPSVVNKTTSDSSVASVDGFLPDAWERRLFYGDVSDITIEEDESGVLLPPEYAAIESIFLESMAWHRSWSPPRQKERRSLCSEHERPFAAPGRGYPRAQPASMNPALSSFANPS